MEQVELVLPSLELEPAYLDCEAEFQRSGETFLAAGKTDYRRFVEQCQIDHQAGSGTQVPQTDFFLVRDRTTILGRSGLRHHLNPALLDVGGHIGYRIRPAERHKGYGTQLLALTLLEARARGLHRVLLTCDSDNLASRKIIERNGGQLSSEGLSARERKLVARYWIYC
jgi:predicted acetyltransferase